MRRLRIKYFDIWFVSILLIGTNFFNLISIDEITGAKKDDLILLFVLSGLVLFFIRTKSKMTFNKKTWLLFLTPVVLCFIGAFISNKLYGQSFVQGFLAQRVFMLVPMGFFWIYSELKIGGVDTKKIRSIISIMGRIELTLLMIQCVFGEKFSFLTVPFQYMYRYGIQIYRARTDLILITIAFFIWVDDYINSRDKKKNICFIVMTLVVLMVFVRTRMLMIGYVAMIIVALFLWTPQKRIYKYISMCLMVVVIVVVIGSGLFQNTINTIVTQSDTLAIRAEGRKWYMNALSSHLLFGCGYPHEACREACVAAGFENGIYIVDNGIFGFAYMYGVVGVIWIVSFWIFFMKRAIWIAKNDSNYMYVLYMGLNIVICISLAYFNSYGLCMFMWSALTAMCIWNVKNKKKELLERKGGQL